MPLNLRPIYNRGDHLATTALDRRLSEAYPAAATCVIYDMGGDAVRIDIVIDGYDAAMILDVSRFVTAIDDLVGVERDLTVKGEIRLTAPIAKLPELLKAMTRLREICHTRAAYLLRDVRRDRGGHPRGDGCGCGRH